MALNGLFNKKILITRPQEQSVGWEQKLRSAGAIPQVFPLIEICALRDDELVKQTLAEVKNFKYILFTSVNGVQFFAEFVKKYEAVIPKQTKIGAVGAVTFAALRKYGFKVNIIPEQFTAVALAYALGKSVKGKKILFPSSNIAREELPAILKTSGAEVTILPVYETVGVENAVKFQQMLDEGVDMLTLTSPSAIDSFKENIAGYTGRIAPIACIGPVTAARASDIGYSPAVISGDHTTEGLTQSIKDYFENENSSKKAPQQ